MVLAAPLDNIQCICLVWSQDDEIVSSCVCVDVIPKCTDLNGNSEAIGRCTSGGSPSLGLLAWCKSHASLGSTDQAN